MPGLLLSFSIAPDVRHLPIYAELPLARRLEIGAYAGFPIFKDDG